MSEYIRSFSTEEQRRLEKQALKIFREIVESPNRTEGGTLAALMQEIRYAIVWAKAQRLSNEEIANLPVTYWNLGDRRSYPNLALRDRREEACWCNEVNLAMLPTDLYVEISDGHLPLIDDLDLGD